MSINISIKTGEIVSSSPISQVIKYPLDGRIFYIKQYTASGKKLRKYFGRSRLRAEWENLLFCQQLNINIPVIAAFGEHHRQGALITEEVANTVDLKMLADFYPEFFRDKHFRKKIIIIIADYLSRLHNAKFIYHDLHWRNILITKKLLQPEVYFIDIPSGKIKYFLFSHGVKRDLYCLYKDAVNRLSRTDCLRFYLRYKKIDKLDGVHKKEILGVFEYFKRKRG